MSQQLLMLMLLAIGCNGNQPPIITTSLDGTSVPENTPIGTVIGKVVARDPEGVAIQYAMTSSDFGINSRSGDVRLLRQLDYEAATSVPAVLRVNSFDDPVQTVTTTVTFRIIDVNDQAPIFVSDAFGGAVDENAPNGTVVVTSIIATDRDITGPGLTVECDRANVPAQFAGVCDIFEVRVTERIQVERWGGQIVLRGAISYREKILWQVPLKAFDGVFTTRASAEININDVQNEPPVFISAINKNVIELLEGAIVTEVQAVDQDSVNPRPVVYRLLQNPGDLFSISINNDTGLGEITNIKDLDRDANPTLSDGFVTVVVEAREVINASAGIYGNDNLTTATATIVITVSGINDNPPRFSQPLVFVNLTEDAPNGSPLPGFSLTVSDIDQGGQAGDASFVLFLTEHNDIFEVDPRSGRELANVGIRVKNSSKLDYDGATKGYMVLLVANQTQSSVPFSSTATVIVTLIDVNDLSPVFNRSSYTFSVSETAAAGTPVGSGISASDGDSGLFGTAGIRYRLVGNGADKFRIADPTKPQVSVASCSGTLGVGPNCLDRETQASYSLFLVATDNLGGGNSNSTALTIVLTDENDNAPAFTAASGFYEFFINEGQTSGTPVFQVTALDADSSLNGYNRVQYSLLGENSTAYSGLWQILTGGVITATRPVDFEAIPGQTGRYQFFAQAQDSAPPFRRSVARVVINVIDMNDNPPVFTLTSPIELTILEGPAPSRFLINILATDGDLPTTSNGRVSYSIVSGSQDRFTIDLNNGSLYTTASAVFQFELQSVYVMTIVAQDGGRPQLQASMRVNVRVIDVNNKVPFFSQSPKRVQVNENVPIDSLVTEMAATDQDAGAQLFYSVLSVTYSRTDGSVSPNNLTYFHLDNSTANVTVASRLNRDIVSEATFVIHVSDRNATTLQTATASLIIVVLDVNDQGPSFASPWTAAAPFYNATMDEEEPIGSFVMVLTATDADGPIAEYRITNDPAGAFSISSSGAVTLRGRLDYEARQSTTFVVVAVDSGAPPLSATATVSLIINNVNDVTPTFSLEQYTFSLLESNGTSSSAARSPVFLGIINATDSDIGDFGRLTFSIVSSDFYLVSSATGAEVFANGSALLDREARSQLVVQLQVADSPLKPSVRRFTSVPMYVNLIDVNDNPPRLLVSDYYATTGNNAPNGSLLITMAASDVDLNSTLSYSLIASANAALFTVNSVSGELRTGGSLSDRAGVLTFGGRVSDGLFTASCTIHVTILESTSAPPRWLFPGVNESLQVMEEQYRGLIIARLQAAEDNSSTSGVTRLTYGIIYEGSFVQETPLFRVNPVTGVLTANAILDREATSRHLLNLAVRDQRTPPLESRRLVSVDLIDVDDNAPLFSLPSYTFSTAEDAAVNTSIGRVAATDADSGANAVVRFEIVSGNSDRAFGIDASTGHLFVASALDRERVESYSLRVAAASGSRAASATGASVAVVNVSISDINDNAPAFSSSMYYGSVPYDSAFGQLLVTVAATDPDYAENAQVTFGLTDSRGLMQVDAGGRVTLVNLVPAASAAAHVAVVTASNPNRASVTSSATLSVWFSDSTRVAKLVLVRSPEWVSQHLQQLLDQVQAATNATRVFANRVRYHLDRGGASDLTKTDVLVSVVGPGMQLMTGDAVAAAVRARAANAATSANLQFLQLQSAVTFDEEAGKLDVSLPIILSISALAAVLVGTAAYAVALYCMQRSLAARCQQQAGISSLQVLQIQGVQKKNAAFDGAAFD